MQNYWAKIKDYGLRHCLWIGSHRLKAYCRGKYWRYHVKHSRANHSWNYIAERNRLPCNYSTYRSNIIRAFTEPIKLPYHVAASPNSIVAQADQYLAGIYILFAQTIQLSSQASWHQDFILSVYGKTDDIYFDASSFYKDITLCVGTEKLLSKDIKVPWELSRFQHLSILGKAYQFTNDERYAKYFEDQILDWLQKNSYLRGIHWLCPMEVSLRAINWIWACNFFYNSPEIAPSSWEKIVCSLYDHWIYLENNWELYDGKTNNHYLADLVGYLYLCWLFWKLPSTPKKFAKIYKLFLLELDKQIFAEGTSYEGSTAYHVLVTDLLLHAQFIIEQLGYTFPKAYQEKIERMLDFIAWCTTASGKLIGIGDNDSAKVTACPINLKEIRQRLPMLDTPITQEYRNFGVSFIITKDWHASMRHHAYQKKQPTGHFHQDILSCTITYQSIPIFIDPGSFVYTASAPRRNQYRAVSAHCTFYLESTVDTELSRLFALPINPQVPTMQLHKTPNNIALSSHHDLYSNKNIRAHRSLSYNILLDKITLEDWWEYYPKAPDKLCSSSVFTSNFALGSTIKLVPKASNRWVIYHHESPLLELTSSQDLLDSSIHLGTSSDGYYQETPSAYFTFKMSLRPCQRLTITLTPLS
jgi:hypothetical protein